MTPKKPDKNNANKCTTNQKKGAVPSRDPVMKTAFIRVTKVNHTGEDKKLVVTFSESQIKDILDEWAWSSGLTYWFIEHTPDDEDPNDHFHIVIQFRTNSHFSTIKSKFPFGNIQTAKIVRKAVQYLVHLNHPEKLSYSWDQVITNCSDMTPYKVMSRSQQDVCLQRIFEKIDSGEITPFNYDKSIPMDIYAKHRLPINNAFQYKTDQIVSNNQRKIKVIYIYGKSGIGKTRLAQDYCKAVHPDEEPCITSSSNDPLQDYRGQKSLVWDDFRDSQFRFADLLKFLDPFTRSSGKSRYYNKHFLGDLIVITSTQRIDFLYKGCDNSEDLMQLRRRISEYHEIIEDKVRIFLYSGNNSFKPFKEHLNPYYGYDQKPIAETCFNPEPYEIMGIKLQDIPASVPVTQAINQPQNKTPLADCAIIQYNGKHRTATKSITQSRIEDTHLCSVP